MKVLQIDAYHHILGGAEKVMFNTADLLTEHGHEVIFFALQWRDNFESKYSSYFASSRESRQGVLSPLKNIISYFYHEDAARKLKLLIEKEHPDVAQIHLIWGNVTPSILPILRRHHIPIVLTVHDYRMVCPGYLFKNGRGEICEQCEGHKYWKCITNKCCKGSYLLSGLMAGEIYFRNHILHAVNSIDGFVFVSHFSRQKHESYMPLLKDKQGVVLYNFSDTISNNIGIPTNPHFFLYYGRLSHEKGVHTLIKSVSKNTNLQFKIVGTGPEEESLKQEVENQKLNNIEFLGYKQGEELHQLVKNAYFVIVPSECYENNPMTIVEAYSASTPVIGSRIGGIPEIIEDGKTGFCFEYGQANSLHAALEKASHLSDEEYLEMRKHALRFARQHFDRENYYQKLMDFYQDIINQK